MLKGTFTFLIWVYIQVLVKSQTANECSCMVSAYEVSILALLVLLSLLSIATLTVAFLVFRRMDKIMRNLSEEKTPYAYVNHYGRPNASSPKWVTRETMHTDCQVPTRPSCVSLVPNQNQELFQSPATASTCLDTLRMKPPPDYEDTMSRLARHSRVPRSLSLENPVRVVEECDDSQSHYMEMKSCTISAFSSNLGAESIYDTPRSSYSQDG